MSERSVIDRTRPVKPSRKRPFACRYEVVVYHTEHCWDQQTGEVVAKFAYKGDAFTYAKGFTNPVFCVVVRN